MVSKGNGSGIKINFTADVQKALDGTAKLEDGLDDVGDKLDDVADASRRSTRKQSQDLQDVERASKTAYDEVGDQAEKGFAKTAKEAGQAGTAIGAGLKDVVRDFDGSVESMGGAVTDTLSGVSALIPGVGGFIGASLASVASGLFTVWDNNAKKTEDRVAEMYQNLIESGQTYQTREQISGALDELYGDPQRFREATSDAQTLGQAVSDVGLALVTDGPQREAAISRINDLLAENSQRSEDAATQYERQAAIVDRVPLQQLKDKLDGLNKAQDDAGYAAAVNRRSQEDLNETFDEQGAAIQKVSDAISELPEGQTVKLTVDSSDVDKFLRRSHVMSVDIRPRAGQRVY